VTKLIIGHATANSCRIWVRGDKKNHIAYLNVDDRVFTQVLSKYNYYTAIFDVFELKANTTYECSVSFMPNKVNSFQSGDLLRVYGFNYMKGKFRTFPTPTGNRCSFFLGSCSLNGVGVLQDPTLAYKTIYEINQMESPSFMIHCGDQIYYDFPNIYKKARFSSYVKSYLDAWSDSLPTQKLLTEIPNYMILDDHELINDFKNDMPNDMFGNTVSNIRLHGLRAYEIFQNSHNPDPITKESFYYQFSHGVHRFFCLDSRTEKYSQKTMIGEKQLLSLKKWLIKNKHSPKFIITSTPFLAEISEGDKWCNERYMLQRENILLFLLNNNISNVVFLTGDMHCSCHTLMKIENSESCIYLHELMSSPINQTFFASQKVFRNKRKINIEKGYKYETKLIAKSFFNRGSNAMLINIENEKVNYEIFSTRIAKRHEVDGEFIIGMPI